VLGLGLFFSAIVDVITHKRITCDLDLPVYTTSRLFSCVRPSCTDDTVQYSPKKVTQPHENAKAVEREIHNVITMIPVVD
jgi:hypothetical protein